MKPTQNPEIITFHEALTRLNLGELAEGSHGEMFADILVGWTGYPVPFACGHTGVYGFGPLDDAANNNHRGAGRRYQKVVRVSQHVCGGNVLFNWARYSDKDKPFQLRGGCFVAVTKTDDNDQTCLSIGVSG